MAVEAVDRHVGTVLRAMWQRRPSFPGQWLVVVTSDHGGKGTSHSDGQREPDVLTVLLIVSGSAAQHGRIGVPTYIVDAPVGRSF